MLIRLAQGKGKKPQQTAEVWKAFERLHLPYGDKDFIRRALWAKLPVAERLQAWTKNALCEMCGVPENHRHVYGHCKYIPYALDVVSKTFSPCKGADGTPLDPTTILADHPLISLTTTQGLVIWAAVLSSWSLRCSQVLHQQTHGLDEFVATWLSKLEQWRTSRGCTLPRKDLSTVIGQLLGWQIRKAVFALGQTPKGPWVKPAGAGGGPATESSKQQKYAGQKQQLIDEIQRKQVDGWTIVFTDGSAKVVKGWSQAGYGGWYGHGADKNFSIYMPLSERQSNNRAELRAVLQTLQLKQPSERLHVVMDAEIVYKGITEWMFKWRRHGWVGAAGPVGHSDLWQQIYILTLMHGDTLSFQWVPSHIGIEGNEQADRLAELGRLQHPHNATQVQKRRCLAEGREYGWG